MGNVEERSSEFIELACLRLAHMQYGCGDLLAVRIGSREAVEGEPNWQVLGFTPQLRSSVADGALRAIDVLRKVYALKRRQAGRPHDQR